MSVSLLCDFNKESQNLSEIGLGDELNNEATTSSPLVDELARLWDERPSVIRAFVESRPQYQQLCSEIEYILRKRIGENGIEYSTLTSRTKTLRSFAEKILRKQYQNPLQDITDLAGVRLVYLYKTDLPAIEMIILSEFEIVERIDKLEEQEENRFGYGALHYLIRLRRKSSGARYDDLKGLMCELQVRTIGQDTWAIFDHHLSYKHESDVPKLLRRKINSLSGLFETADDQFDQIRRDREEYRQAIKSKLEDRYKGLDQEFNLDTLIEYLSWRYPDRPVGDNRRLTLLLSKAAEFGYYSLTEIHQLLDRTEKARDAMAKVSLPAPSSAGDTLRAIALEQPAERNSGGWSTMEREFEKYEFLLDRNRR
jgi:putative GTP pyrophosphokinase